ncbi:MAG: hypothetical protein Q4A16_03520 [Lautropia sp.]|nr:hypothetical protein [Lautropia sp.]
MAADSYSTHANVIRILVPLTAADALLDEGLQIIADGLAAALQGRSPVTTFSSCSR